MSAPDTSKVIGTPDGRHVVHETTDGALAAALARAELDRRGIPRERVEAASTVHAHLSSLERKGFIRRDPTKPRALVVEVPS